MDEQTLPSDLGLVDCIDDPTSDAISSLQSFSNVFTHGDSDDIFAMLSELPRLLQICPDGLVDTILPALCPIIPEWPHDLQLAAGTELLTLCRSPHISAPVAKIIALSAVQIVLPLSTASTALIPQLLLTFGDILAIALPFAKCSQQHCIRFFTLVDHYSSSPVPDERLVAVKVLRGLSAADYATSLLESALLPRLWNMLPDNDSFITAHLIAIICTLTAHFSERKFYDRVWSKLIALWETPLTAPDGFAKSTTLTALSNLLSQPETATLFAQPHLVRLSSFFPIVCNFAFQLSRDSITYLPESAYECLVTIAVHIPTIMTYLSDHGAIQWHKYALRSYSVMSSCDDSSIRAKCALNLPVVCSAYRGKNTATLTRLAETFCYDDNSEVRRNFAQVFQQIVPFLATHNTGNLFKRMFQLLLDDADKPVTAAVVDSLGLTLKALATLKSNRSLELHFALPLEQVATAHDWRTRETLARQFGIAAKTLSARQRDDVLILLRVMFRDGATPVRKAAGAAYLRVIRMIRKVDERWEEINSFFGEFGTATCTVRLTVIDTLFYAADLFSAHAFGIMFAPFLLQMTSDGVSNVRLKIATNLHRVAVACQAIGGYDEAIYTLRNDSDIDVRTAMEGFVERAAAHVKNNKRLARRDAKKLAFERWLYEDRFSTADPVIGNEERQKSERSDRSNDRREARVVWTGKSKRSAIKNALSKVKVFFGRSKRKLKEHVSAPATVRAADSGSLTPGGATGSVMSMPLNDDASSEDWVRLPDRENGDRFDEMSFSTASFGEMTSQWMSSADNSSVATTSVVSHVSQSFEVCGEYEPAKQPLSMPMGAGLVVPSPVSTESRKSF